MDAYTVMGLSFVPGKSPAEPAQKELPQTEIESVGMVVSAGVDRYFFDVAVCTDEEVSVIAFQSRSLPAALITVEECPVAGVLMGSVGVGMNVLCGMASWMVVAVIASANP